MSDIVFTPDGFEDYTYWQSVDRSTQGITAINKLFMSTQNNKPQSVDHLRVDPLG